MDLVRLGPAYSTTYIPDQLIEGYNSLIWTERFQAPGEFELKSFDVAGLSALLPEDTLVSHLETQEVMQVETHEIAMVGEGADAEPEITIRGRSASTILEHRWVEANYQKKRRMRKKYSAAAAAGVLIYNAIDNNSGADLTRGDDDPDTEGVVNHYDWTTKDVIPNVVVTEVVAREGETRWWKLAEGMLYPQLMRILSSQDLGLRCMRPIVPNNVTVLTVKKALAERGTVVRTPQTNVTALRFDIYKGLDRSGSVQLSLLQGHLDNPQYLTSNRNLKSVIEVTSGEVKVGDVYRTGESGLTGWQRRASFLDAGTPEIPPQPEKPEELNSNATNAQKQARAEAIDAWKIKMGKWRNKRDNIVADFKEEARKDARRELQTFKRVNMFTGDVSSLAPYKYKTHYDLGDTVTIVGDYGKSHKMVVIEYVRSEDINGDRGYPGLILPDLA